MPTYNQRAIAIADALVNGTATADQRARLAAAFSASLPPGATQSQVSEQMVKEVRQMVLDRVLFFETQTGMSAVREAKAHALPQDFAELP